MSKVSQSRFANSARNMVFSTLAQVLTIVLNVVGRRVFVDVLSKEYLGISTAFTSILAVLALAELGVGSAIIYSLYKPIAEHNEEKICSLMRLYKQVYCCVGALILVAGSALTPFLHLFVDEMPDIAGIHWIYLMIVAQSGVTYFFSYKTSFLTATQQSHILRKYDIVATAVQIGLQILALLLTGNYFLYLGIGIICPFMKNVFATMQIDRMYPFLRQKAKKLDKEETGKIKKNVLALFIYKVCQKLSTTIDTLLISKMLGVQEVAIYSNYHLIISYSDMLFINVLGAVTPSVGNLMATEDTGKKRAFFSALQMIYYWVATYLAVGLIVLFNPLIQLWLGDGYLFDQSIVIALAVSITLTNFQRPCSLVRDANGLFWYGKFRPLAMAIINLGVSIYLVTQVGTIGVVIGTCVSKLATFVWYDPYIVYKHALKEGLKQYFIKYVMQWGLLAALAAICYYLFRWMALPGLLGFVVGALLVTVVVNGVFVLLYFRTPEFSYIKAAAGKVLGKFLKPRK